MNLDHSSMARLAFGGRWTASLALGAMLAASSQAAISYYSQADTFRPVPAPGGIDVKTNTAITNMSVVGSNVTLYFRGLQAPYDVQVSTNLFTTWTTGATTAIKYPNYQGSVTVSNVDAASAQLRLSLRDHAFVGAIQCNGCHGEKVSEWGLTPHATAIYELMDTNGSFTGHAGPSCVPCHSVGNGQPGGFVNLATTPRLANVGCESCHGPAGQHINVSNRRYHPVASIAPEVCGGCHTGSHHPTYDEYLESPHSFVTPDVSYGISSGTGYPDTINVGGTNWYGYVVATNGATNMAAGIVNSLNPASGFGRQMSCGACHSGATRMAMLADYEARQNGYTNALALPSPRDGATWGPTCAVCHDPHADENPAQLRNPMRSTNYYTLFTASVPAYTNYGTNVFGGTMTNVYYMNDGFASQYNPDVQVCAQCHNSRGARWDGRSLVWTGSNMVMGTSQSFSRPPHHSPQYNLLVGIVQPDYLNTNSLGVATNYLQRHGTSASSSGVYNTNQCASCHVVSYAVNSSTNVTGHTFEMNTRGCTTSGCHGTVPSIEEEQLTTTNGLSRVVNLLSQWALANGTNLFGAVNANKYKQNGWEYTTIGALAPATNAGPSSSDQLKLPDTIKQARFNAYMVLHDGSLGVHNPRYTSFLLSDAETKVLGEFKRANFKAYSTAGFAPFKVGFTNLAAGILEYNWAFGDGNTSTEATPTNTYALPGVYTVGLTATSASGAETLYRTNYITVVEKPAVSGTADVTSGTAPLKVNFTNTSTGTSGVTAWRWTVNEAGRINVTGSDVTYTYTNAGSYRFYLRASTPAGNVYSLTNTITVTAP